LNSNRNTLNETPEHKTGSGEPYADIIMIPPQAATHTILSKGMPDLGCTPDRNKEPVPYISIKVLPEDHEFGSNHHSLKEKHKEDLINKMPVMR